MADVTATDARETIASNVRAELARAGKPAGRFLSDLLGLDEGSVSLRLRGRRAFKADELALIAAALDIPATRFMERVA